ncbi:putative nucleosome assembly protein (NAP) [Helianthus debilis subsp. tardiflorus]
MVSDKGKKPKIGDKIEEGDVELLKSIEKLQEVQDELEKINEEASDNNKVWKPVYVGLFMSRAELGQARAWLDYKPSWLGSDSKPS